MPLYTIECPGCGRVYEEFQGMNDAHVDVACPDCGTITNRSKSRAWTLENIGIQGDTCSGCENYSNYFDSGLNTFITGRHHREQVMKEQGKTEWVAGPDQKYHDESRYIREHAPVGDPTAIKAARKQGALADQARKKRVRDKGTARFKQILESEARNIGA